MIRKILTAILFVCAAMTVCASNHTFHNESLTYRVMYKWGLINKQAGTATLSIHEGNDRYTARLIAHSEPWADKFYCVRDTLNGIILKNGLKPLRYEKIAHEGSEHKHDIVEFSYSGTSVVGTTSRRVVKKGELKKEEHQTLNATGTTVDMLSSFYYMRTLPFESWQPGHKQAITIFSGKTKETLTFVFHGKETIKVNDSSYNCYHITFVFTGSGGKKTSDNMDAWITADTARLPVLLEGKLPVGKVKCELIR